MRIVVDLQGCQSASRYRGIGRYSMALAQAMARRAGNHELWLVLNGRFSDTIEPIREAFSGLVDPNRIVVFQVPGPVAEWSEANAWRGRAAELIREHAISELAPDIVHVSSLFEGWLDDATTSVGLLSHDFATAVTLYDLIPLLWSDVYLRDPRERTYYYRKLRSLKSADLLAAISDYSRKEAITALGLGHEQVINISGAADDRFRCLALPDDKVSAIRSRYGLYRPIVMSIGTVEPRKNIEGLIKAYALLPVALRRTHQLIVVCQAQDHDRARLLALAERSGLGKDEVVLPSFVPDDDLVALYNLCKLFVFPSLHEGFGLPALEAMACGAPTIGSNISSIPEMIGRGDALFDPAKPEAIAAKIKEGLTDEGFLRSLREHAPKQASKFSWDESASRALEAFDTFHERLAPSRSQHSSEVISDDPRLPDAHY